MATPTRARPEVARRPRPKREFPFPLNIYQTAVGKKWVMALTGVGILGFVLLHMIGNLKIYLGAADMFHYGEALRDLLVPLIPRTVVLWMLRIGIIVMFALHIHAFVSLTRMNRESNEKYQSPRDMIAVNFASRSMRWTGTIVGIWLIYHLADLTWGFANPDFVRGDPYNNLVHSFEQPVVAIIYIIANVLLGIHIFHGAWSLFQSLGINSPRYNRMRRQFATGFALVIVIGNLSFPIAVMVGFIEHVDPTYMEGAGALSGLF